MTAELRPEWTCSECEVRCYRMTGEPFPRPEGWVGDLCLACAKKSENAEDRALRMVLEGKRTNEISRACKGVAKRRINEMRDLAIQDGDLDPATVEKASKPKRSPEPKPRPEPKAPDPKRVASEELMREDPPMSNGEIADLTGASRKAVGVWRRKLDIPTSESVRRAEATALISADPTLRNAEVQERMRYPVSATTIRKVRSELGIAPPAAN